MLTSDSMDVLECTGARASTNECQLKFLLDSPVTNGWYETNINCKSDEINPVKTKRICFI
jgi:hypothetical protein